MDSDGGRVKVFVTGASGFIGHHVVNRLIQQKMEVIGVGSLSTNNISLKLQRLQVQGIKISMQNSQPSPILVQSSLHDNYRFLRANLFHHADSIQKLMQLQKFDYVIHLAAQSGVRESLDQPQKYVEDNINAFMIILSAAQKTKVKHFVYASSGSVYGLNQSLPLTENHSSDHPTSFYAATKKVNETLAYSYSCLHHLPTSGLRLFRIYGEWSRSDIYFADAIYEKKTLSLFNYGKMIRDFTYVSDAVQAVYRVMLKPSSSNCPFNLFNVGNSEPIELLMYVETLEKCLHSEADKKLVEPQPGEVLESYSECSKLQDWIGFKPNTPLEIGLHKFCEWYLAWKG